MTTKDFLENDHFIFYMLTKDSKSIEYWESYLKEYPEDRLAFEKAQGAFKTIKVVDKKLEANERKALQHEIFKSAITRRERTKKTRIKRIYFAAASVLLFLFFGVYSMFKSTQTPEILVEKPSSADTIELITENKVFSLSNNEVLTINESGITNSKGEHIKINDKLALNTLKVPFGQRTELILPDSSKLWVNSGSLIKFPSKFNGNKRHIFLEGEIFIEVSKDQTKPFTVETPMFNVNVYGTTFNVKAYKNATEQRVVLVEGSVGVTAKGFKEGKMLPGESIEVTKTGLVKKNVDTELYTSWKNGYLIFNETPIEAILLELSRYYNITFTDIHKELEGRTCTGKIYLSEHLDDVLETLSVLSKSSFKIKPSATID